jgi:hypothetical protein
VAPIIASEQLLDVVLDSDATGGMKPELEDGGEDGT